MAETLRWGILSTAGIACKNWEAIRNSGNGVVTAVASRDAAKAQQFIDGCQAEVPFEDVPRAIGGYDEIIAADDVDAVIAQWGWLKNRDVPLTDEQGRRAARGILPLPKN